LEGKKINGLHLLWTICYKNPVGFVIGILIAPIFLISIYLVTILRFTFWIFKINRSNLNIYYNDLSNELTYVFWRVFFFTKSFDTSKLIFESGLKLHFIKKDDILFIENASRHKQGGKNKRSCLLFVFIENYYREDKQFITLGTAKYFTDQIEAQFSFTPSYTVKEAHNQLIDFQSVFKLSLRINFDKEFNRETLSEIENLSIKLSSNKKKLTKAKLGQFETLINQAITVSKLNKSSKTEHSLKMMLKLVAEMKNI
jgi:hypothetical protein